MNSTTGLNLTIQDMAKRIRALREIEGYTIAEMAVKTGLSVEEYTDCESGSADLSFAFLYRCALIFGVDVTDLIQGSSPTLSSYVLTRKGQGQRIEEAHGLTYYNMAAAYRNRIAEPLCVISAYSEQKQHRLDNKDHRRRHRNDIKHCLQRIVHEPFLHYFSALLSYITVLSF